MRIVETSRRRALANFVEVMPDEDPDLNLYALRRASGHGGRLSLTLDSVYLLSRFGLDKGAWQSSRPAETQMRNILRRIDGVEARERHARKLRTEMGYGNSEDVCKRLGLGVAKARHIGRAVGCIESPHLRSIRVGSLANAGEVSKQEAGCLDRIVPGGHGHDEGEPGLDEGCELGTLRELAAVSRDEAVPVRA